MLVWVVEWRNWRGEDYQPIGFAYPVFRARQDAREWVAEHDPRSRHSRIRRYRLVPVKGKKT